jgi:selenoprotein W-related protein
VFGVEPRLIRSSGGVFEVVVDGALVHSKKGSGQFPDEDELIRRLRKRAG